jgi:hypothetical protein
MKRRRLFIIGIPLALNFIISWTILPFVVPPFGGYPVPKLLDVILWQGIGTVGWPFAILGTLLSLPFGQYVPRLGDLLLTLMYPAMLVLLTHTLTAAEALRRWQLVLLHMLLTVSFAAVWYHVLNGYNFMVG